MDIHFRSFRSSPFANGVNRIRHLGTSGNWERSRCSEFFSNLLKKGFTLVELLVVVAIIAILAGLLLPGLKQARDLGQRINCVNNIRQLGALLLMYANEHETYLPPTCDASSTWWGDYLVTNKYVKTSAIAYSANPTDKTLLCPGSRVLEGGGVLHSYYHGHYGMNTCIALTAGAGTPAVMTTSISNHAGKILILDSGVLHINYYYITTPGLSVWYVPGASANSTVDWSSSGYVNQLADALKGRHGGMINICYLDGHAGTTKADLITDTALWTP